MEICPENICTGCGACISICPVNCISMKEDKYGEGHPAIDKSICINCGKCRQVCPNNNEPEFNMVRKCYAAWDKNKENRRKCASGGIASLISNYFIENEGGIVFGTSYDENLDPCVSYAERTVELEKFKGSKYVQSYFSKDEYKAVKDFLGKGLKVLFIGTPCQVSGLLSYMGKDNSDLYTCDLLCHGTCPSSYLKDEVIHLIGKRKPADNIRFRGNDDYDFHLSIWNENDCLYNKKATDQPYLYGFLNGVTLRECCYSCRYTRSERVSDITLGDFIMLGKNKPFGYPTDNVSYVTVNTKKGERLFNAISENIGNMIAVERDYTERLEYPQSIKTPSLRHQATDRFRKKYIRYGFHKAVRMTLLPEMAFEKAMKTYRKIHNMGHRILHVTSHNL
jgi:coenzyme F420-reducing hydrogenase beta subunit